MKVKVDEELVQEIGAVMKLEFTDAQMTTIVSEINSTVAMFEELNELDTEGVEPTFYGLVNKEAAFRKDEAKQDLEEVDALLENTPRSKDRMIEVPAILDDGEGGA